EFTALREAYAAFVGEYLAGQIAAGDRLWALAWSAKWQEALSAWQQIPADGQRQGAWAAGRAYVETGDDQKGIEQLRLTARTAHDWSNARGINGGNFLAGTMAQFYLGRAYEHEGKKAEAINAYQEFLNHFENSTARLPQIAEARAALKRLL
ncbi:MAG TPA: tetratricopeptide repeat protein, partial [Candidatus Acidoferrales bacterium]|nr:tetratricopeptide repeat protein [Candidatus Acidoferrales bacterium]